jgi:hypothetical protein
MPPYMIGGLPAPDMMPVAEVAEAITELQRLQAAWREEQAKYASILGGRAEQDARQRDAALLADAARAGKDVAKVGSPNVDKLQADRKAYEDVKRGYDSAIDAQARKVADLIVEHGEKLAEGVEERAEKAAAKYGKLAAEIAAARAALVAEVYVRQFLADRAWQEARKADPLAPRPRKYDTGHMTKGIHPIAAGSAFAAAKAEAETVMRVEQPSVAKVPGPSGHGYTHRPSDEPRRDPYWYLR